MPIGFDRETNAFNFTESVVSAASQARREGDCGRREISWRSNLLPLLRQCHRSQILLSALIMWRSFIFNFPAISSISDFNGFRDNSCSKLPSQRGPAIFRRTYCISDSPVLKLRTSARPHGTPQSVTSGNTHAHSLVTRSESRCVFTSFLLLLVDNLHLTLFGFNVFAFIRARASPVRRRKNMRARFVRCHGRR